MKLDTLNITFCDYGPNKGQYRGNVRFQNESGSVDITLHPDISKRVLQLCAEALVQQAQETGRLTAGEVLEQTAALENKA